MRKFFFRPAAVLLLIATCPTRPGELRLDNGAVLPGELSSIDNSTLAWKADKVGTVTVAKADVLELSTGRRVAVRETLHQPPRDDCLVEVTYRKWTIDCGAGPAESVAFAQLRSLPHVPSSTGKLAIALDVDRGTKPSEEITLDLEARWLRRGHRHNVRVSTDYEQSEGTTTNDEADANYQYDLLRPGGWYWFGRTRYYRDEFEALQQVYAAGAGIGREFTAAENITLSLQGGPALMYYQYQDQDWQAEPGSSARWTVVWHTPWRGMEASHSGELGWIFSVSDAYLIQSKTGLTFPLYKGLVAELRLDYDRSGVEVGNNGDHDMEWVLALGYKW